MSLVYCSDSGDDNPPRSGGKCSEASRQRSLAPETSISRTRLSIPLQDVIGLSKSKRSLGALCGSLINLNTILDTIDEGQYAWLRDRRPGEWQFGEALSWFVNMATKCNRSLSGPDVNFMQLAMDGSEVVSLEHDSLEGLEKTLIDLEDLSALLASPDGLRLHQRNISGETETVLEHIEKTMDLSDLRICRGYTELKASHERIQSITAVTPKATWPVEFLGQIERADAIVAHLRSSIPVSVERLRMDEAERGWALDDEAVEEGLRDVEPVPEDIEAEGDWVVEGDEEEQVDSAKEFGMWLANLTRRSDVVG